MSQAISGVPTIRATTPATGGLARPFVAIATALRWASREWRVQRDLHRLQGLDARMLADIGIGPGEAESAVRNGRGRMSACALRPLPPERRPTAAVWTEWR